MLSKIFKGFSNQKAENDSDLWWLPLGPETPSDTSVLGNKGAGLIRLMKAGFNVPAGVIMTTQFLHDFYFLEEPAVRRLIDEAIATPARSDVLWAVRCSVADGDGAQESVIDRLETFLNVPFAELFDCVKQCWSSVYADCDMAYRLDRKPENRPFLAVILQQMAAVQCAGVLYTRPPDHPDKDGIVIKGVSGLHEDLRSGLCKPDCLVLSRDGQRLVTEDDGRTNCLDQVSDAVFAQLARDLEQAFGKPQDAEWVYDGQTLWVVENRPSAA